MHFRSFLYPNLLLYSPSSSYSAQPYPTFLTLPFTFQPSFNPTLRAERSSYPTMASSKSSHIYEILGQLNRRQTIPSFHREALEERLVISCKPLGRQQRRKVRRTQQEIRSHYKQRKAQKVYLEVLDEDPHVFLPFILAISPKACESFDISGFCQCHKKCKRIYLSNDAKTIFEDIAKRQKLDQSPHYKRLIEVLFPQGEYNNLYLL